MTTAVANRELHGPRFRSVLGSALRPLCAERFCYHQRLSVGVDGGYLVQECVPAGKVAVITVVAGLARVLDACYSIIIDSVPVPDVRDIGEWAMMTVNDYRVFSWPIGVTTLPNYFVKGGMLLDPIIVDQNATFGLFVINPGVGGWAGGGVMGYYMPRDVWRESA
jgi:hypothetical protein